jgi:hypothetical protein
MPRNVFFSFHYQRDIMRVQVVKNHHITKGSYTTAGYFDGSLEEKAKKDGDPAVKRLIDNGMSGSSVTCVLIGNETYTRRWVDYEILKSVELGMGVVGVRIHQIKDPTNGADTAGSNPFDYLGFGTNNNDDKLVPMIKYTEGWKNAPLLSPISRSSAEYLPASGNGPILSTLFSVYDWESDNGYLNFGKWIEAAAKQAGK